MKKLVFILISIAWIGLMFTSCEEEEIGPVLKLDDVVPPSIQAPADGGTFVFTEDQAQDNFDLFQWVAADYGYDAAVSYSLQIDVQGNNFADAVEIGNTTSDSLRMTVDEFNSKLLNLGLTPDQAADIELRVRSVISEYVDTFYSAPVGLTVTPYLVEIVYPSLWVPGDFQAASGYGSDWSPGDAGQIWSPTDNGRYEGYINFAGSANFKFTSQPDWNGTNYGDSGTEGELSDDGGAGNLTIAEAGYYKFNVDINTLTYTQLKTDWGLVGDATGSWDTDQDMTYDMTAKTWSITLDLVVGKIKFRANDGWDLNYGDIGADGILEAGGDDIDIPEAGNYTVTLNLANYPYSYTVVKN